MLKKLKIYSFNLLYFKRDYSNNTKINIKNITTPFYISTDTADRYIIIKEVDRKTINYKGCSVLISQPNGKEKWLTIPFIVYTKDFSQFIKKLQQEANTIKLLKEFPEYTKHYEYRIVRKDINNIKKRDYLKEKFWKYMTPLYDPMNSWALKHYNMILKDLNCNITMKTIDSIQNRTAIYMFMNKINRKFYIGKATCIQSRLKTYSNLDKVKNLQKSKIYREMDKFGLNNFTFSILEYCTKADLNTREQLYINAFKPQYNIRKRVSKL